MTSQAELLESIARRDAIQAELDAAALEVSRQLWTMHVEGSSHSSIAALLGLSRQRVGQLLARAEKELREEYERERHEGGYVRGAIRKAEAHRNRGMESGGFPCFVKTCRRFKSRPSSECDHCGDIPVTHNATAREIADFDRAYGYA